MKTLKLNISIILLFGFLSSYSSDSHNDTLICSEIESLQFSDNLDSLLNLWYVQQSVFPSDSGQYTFNINDSLIPEFPDSVYMQRINELPVFIDLSYNKVVRNFIHLYTIKKRGLVEVMLGLQDYYFPVFEEILDANNLPLELKYLPVIESALNPRAVSRAGATGIWQFMYSTGKMYKLEINSYIDERKDPVKSTYAAVNFLKDLYNIYGDWILAIAAYNCGPGNVNKAIRRSGGKRNYWDIYYRLPRETRGYVPAFIAANYVMNYYSEHNLTPQKIEIPVFVDTIMINEKLHLKQVSEVLNMPIKQLRDLNPQYRRDIIPAGKKSYSLKLPVEYTMQFIDLSDSIFDYKDSVFFNPNIIHNPPEYTRYVPKPPSKDHIKIYYTVQSGDNLGYIADWYNVRISDLRYWNNIRRNLIRAGQKLVIYKKKNIVGKYKKINSMSFAEKQKMIGKTVPTEIADNTKQEEYPDDNNYVYYTVKRGDNLWDIAKKYPGVSNTDIMKINNITNANNLTPGQKLRIKRKG
ncbi:MAG: transglycosylase SLT domain-containing protein [Bacteroidales bacterium]|nr:transglycosylase SLT domain-containing protein [Bacteroidales bacterium]